MADFTSRPSEVDTQVKEVVEWSKAEQASGLFGNPKPVPDAEVAEWARSFDQERTNLPAKVGEYFSARSRRLNDLVDGMGTVVSGGKDADALWKGPTEGLAADVASILSGTLSGLSRPSGKATGLLFRIQTEEDAFARGLAGRGAADAWAKLTALAAKVQRTTLEMSSAWEQLVSQEEDIDTQAADKVNNLVAAMRGADDAVRARYEAAERTLASGNDDLSGVADAASLVTFDGTSTEKIRELTSRIEKVMSGLSSAIKDLDQLTKDLVARREAAENALTFLGYLQDSEVGAVLLNYKRLRAGAEDLARDPSPDRAAEELAAGTRRSLSDWSGSMANPGQRSDAEKLAGLLTAETDAIERVVKDAWATLRKENDGRWLGSLSSTARNQLVRIDSWNSRRRDVDGVNLTAGLDKVKDGAGRGFGLDLDRGARKVIDAVNGRPGVESERLDVTSALDRQAKEVAEQLSSVKLFLGHTAGRWSELLTGPLFERAIRRSAVDSGLS